MPFEGRVDTWLVCVDVGVYLSVNITWLSVGTGETSLLFKDNSVSFGVSTFFIGFSSFLVVFFFDFERFFGSSFDIVTFFVLFFLLSYIRTVKKLI